MAEAKSETEKMLTGELYCAWDPDLSAARKRARHLCKAFNESDDDQRDERRRIMDDLFGSFGENSFIEPPFFCDYGSYTKIGKNVFMNFNCVILDCGYVEIGDDTMFGPAVQIYAASHTLSASVRHVQIECGKPVKIGSDCWIGGGAIFCPGVTVGDKTVIGAGSVVTKDIPGSVVAVGNPCRVIRQLVDGEAPHEESFIKRHKF